MLTDLGISFAILLLSPLLLAFNKRAAFWVKNGLKVTWGNVSWIGPDDSLAHKMNFPKLKRGIFHPTNRSKSLNESLSIYWRNYLPLDDVKEVWRLISLDSRFRKPKDNS